MKPGEKGLAAFEILDDATVFLQHGAHRRAQEAIIVDDENHRQQRRLRLIGAVARRRRVTGARA